MSNYIVDIAISDKRFNREWNIFYYPVMMIGYDGERRTVISIKLYYDEFSFARPKGIKALRALPTKR